MRVERMIARAAVNLAWYEVRPFFMYHCPGLEFIEASLDYYERFFGTHIIRLPHHLLYKSLNDFLYQPPSIG